MRAVCVAIACGAFWGGPARADSPPYETVVTAQRLPRPLPDVPATVTVLPREELERVPALGTDELVRLVPAASTFRRTPSLRADPSAQGLSLRALGPSGVSRALVLVDGVPFNDPFGGWIYWRALPRLRVDRIEVVPGPGSALYGNHALGGVVQIASRPLEPALEADVTAGSLATAALGARAAGQSGALAGGVDVEALRSNGYVPVAPSARGPIDAAGASRHGSVHARSELNLGAGARVGVRAGLFAEDQNGGTALTTAKVRTGSWAATVARDGADGSHLDLVLYGSVERFAQVRPRIAAGRVSESVAASQSVRSHGEGASVGYALGTIQALGLHQLLVGTDLRRVAGTSSEDLTPASLDAAPLVARVAGGAQDFVGAFVQEIYAPASWLELTLGVRGDWWRSHAGRRDVTDAGGATVAQAFADQTATAWSPRVAFLVRPSETTRVRGSLARAFRAPTLNELYRPFQVGTVLTGANQALRAERLTGAELGGELAIGAVGVVRATGFWTRLDDAIANVTLGAPNADGATRQRQNLGRVGSRGVDLAADVRVPLAPGLGELSLGAAYTYATSVVTAAPEQPGLVDKDVAHAPRHRGRLALAWQWRERFTAATELHTQGRAFEDDLNTLPMDRYAVVDLFASAAVTSRWRVFASAQNLLDRRYTVGRAGVETQGPPLQLMLGARLR